MGWRCCAAQLVFAVVAAIGSQPHVCRAGATGEVALMAQHRVVGVGPAQTRDGAVFELIGEQMRRHGPAARRSGQGRCPWDNVSANGIAVGTASLYDRTGPLGTCTITALSNARRQVDVAVAGEAQPATAGMI